MTDRQAHRGPDGEGFLLAWPSGHAAPRTRQWDHRAPVRVALGHRRLAILDLSTAACNRWRSRTGTRLRVSAGSCSTARSIITASCAPSSRHTAMPSGLGPTRKCCSRPIGPGARTASPDCRGCTRSPSGTARATACSRRGTRLGIKPFYYATPAGTFAFASEMKALLACPGLDTTPDDDAVVGFLITPTATTASGRCSGR